jgi:Ser/Thr protein kinase RdoA (MazF antagonist)
MKQILKQYGLGEESQVTPLTGGLINSTWKVKHGKMHYILQKINDSVFKEPYRLAENVRMIGEYLQQHSPDYLFVSPIPTLDGTDIFQDGAAGYFRLFPFIEGSHTIDVVKTADEAFEASFQFGKFTRELAHFDAKKLNFTIPGFHDLTLRFKQFEDSLLNGNEQRIRESKDLIKLIRKHTHIATQFEALRKNPDIKVRVTHHDTKISNVLFDERNKGLCVIDLDTVMPGFFISDVGDMMRTYLSPASEEVSAFDEIIVRTDFYDAIVHGYLSSMASELTDDEKKLIPYSGLFLTYMQALRFMTDHINNDHYYGARYEGHNFVRAGNQLTLLERMVATLN